MAVQSIAINLLLPFDLGSLENTEGKVMYRRITTAIISITLTTGLLAVPKLQLDIDGGFYVGGTGREHLQLGSGFRPLRFNARLQSDNQRNRRDRLRHFSGDSGCRRQWP